MEICQSILIIPAFIIVGLYVHFFFHPLALLDLAWDRSIYFLALNISALFLVCYLSSGLVRIMQLAMLLAVISILMLRLPTLRFIEFHTGDGVVHINRIIRRYFWPSMPVRQRFGYRNGKLFNVLPWVDVIEGFQYIHEGETYSSMKQLCDEKPLLVRHAEHALLKSLG